jgi:hypothetical protein
MQARLPLIYFVANLLHAPIQSMFYVFVPKSQNLPTILLEGLIDAAIPSNVAIDLI